MVKGLDQEVQAQDGEENQDGVVPGVLGLGNVDDRDGPEEGRQEPGGPAERVFPQDEDGKNGEDPEDRGREPGGKLIPAEEEKKPVNQDKEGGVISGFNRGPEAGPGREGDLDPVDLVEPEGFLRQGVKPEEGSPDQGDDKDEERGFFHPAGDYIPAART